MLFVLAGPSYVGKKTAIAHFMKLYSFSSVIPYTTKPFTHRGGETEGIQYHYVDETARADIANEEFIFDEPFNFGEYKENTLYAYKKSDIQNAIESYSNFIVHASVGNVEKMHTVFARYHRNPNESATTDLDTWSQQIYFIFLNFGSPLTEDFFRKKQPIQNEPDFRYMSKTEAHNEESFLRLGKKKRDVPTDSFDFERRYKHAQKEVEFYQKHSGIFDETVSSDKIYEICRRLEEIVLPKLRVMPTSPEKIPGPLSDLDILYMCEKRKVDPMEIYINGRKAKPEQVRNLFCGCGMHISLSNIIRKVGKDHFGSFIDMAEDPEELERTLHRAYPEEVIDKGYILRPHEMILCSSDEAFRLPKDVYAMVVSKFSYTQLGLSIELSPSVIQSGHNGKIHFQIKNNTENLICIYPHIQVAQLLLFRTVQPSIKTYHEKGNHSYDQADVSPVSEFRKMNEPLDCAKRPKAGFLKALLTLVEEKTKYAIAGILILFATSLVYADKFNFVLQTYVIPFVKNLNLELSMYVVLFALICCLANSAVFILGHCILQLFRLAVGFTRRTNQGKNKE